MIGEIIIPACDLITFQGNLDKLFEHYLEIAIKHKNSFIAFKEQDKRDVSDYSYYAIKHEINNWGIDTYKFLYAENSEIPKLSGNYIHSLINKGWKVFGDNERIKLLNETIKSS